LIWFERVTARSSLISTVQLRIGVRRSSGPGEPSPEATPPTTSSSCGATGPSDSARCERADRPPRPTRRSPCRCDGAFASCGRQAVWSKLDHARRSPRCADPRRHPERSASGLEGTGNRRAPAAAERRPAAGGPTCRNCAQASRLLRAARRRERTGHRTYLRRPTRS